MDFVDTFFPTSKYTSGNRGRRLWVIHDEEFPEGVNSAEQVCRSLANSTRQASINVCIDADSIAGSVDWNDTSWHAKHAATNSVSVGVEHDGYAKQNRAEWLDPELGLKTLTRSAHLFRKVGMDIYGIKPVHLTGQALRDCVLNGIGSGYCGHGDVTRAFNIYGGHSDPGDWFPYDWWEAEAIDLPAPVVLPEEEISMYITHLDGHDEKFGVYLGALTHNWCTDVAKNKWSGWQVLSTSLWFNKITGVTIGMPGGVVKVFAEFRTPSGVADAVFWYLPGIGWNGPLAVLQP